MESLIERITTKASSMDFTTAGIGGKPKGLDKLSELHGLTNHHINFVIGIYLQDAGSLVRLKAHLVSQADRYILESNKNAIKAVKGALIAYQTNAYRVVDCYKCKAKGCDRCGGTGKTSKKPKSYELCGMNRNTWNNKSNAKVRQVFDKTYAYLVSMEAEINNIYNKNTHELEY